MQLVSRFCICKIKRCKFNIITMLNNMYLKIQLVDFRFSEDGI